MLNQGLALGLLRRYYVSERSRPPTSNSHPHLSSHEAMTDLIALMGTLVDDKGHILIDGLYDDVAPLLPEEEELYKKITFDTVCNVDPHPRSSRIQPCFCLFRKRTVPRQACRK